MDVAKRCAAMIFKIASVCLCNFVFFLVHARVQIFDFSDFYPDAWTHMPKPLPCLDSLRPGKFFLHGRYPDVGASYLDAKQKTRLSAGLEMVRVRMVLLQHSGCRGYEFLHMSYVPSFPICFPRSVSSAV